MWTLRQIASFIRFAFPHVIWLMLWSLGVAIKLVVVAVISMFKGMAVVDELAEHWVQKALDAGFPRIWERQLRFLFRVLGVLTIEAGWAIIFFTTVFSAHVGLSLIR